MTMINNNKNDAAAIRRRMAAAAAQEAAYDLIPEGAYVARATSAEPVQSRSGRDSLRVRFDLLDHEINKGQRGCAFAHLYPDPQPQLRRKAERMAAALGFADLPSAFADELAPGRACRVIVEHWETSAGDTYAKAEEARFEPKLTAALAEATPTTTTTKPAADPHAVDVAEVAKQAAKRQEPPADATNADNESATADFLAELAAMPVDDADAEKGAA
jgi:hypothetical protein